MKTSGWSLVTVKTWTDLTEEARRMGVLIEDREFDDTQCGEYDPDTRTAYIDPTMSIEQKTCTLQHELIHARHFDAGLRIMHPGKEECLTSKETALALINPVDYMHAEDLYGGRTLRDGTGTRHHRQRPARLPALAARQSDSIELGLEH